MPSAHAETLAYIRMLMPLIASHAGDKTIPMTVDQRTAYARLAITLNAWDRHADVVPMLNV